MQVRPDAVAERRDRVEGVGGVRERDDVPALDLRAVRRGAVDEETGEAGRTKRPPCHRPEWSDPTAPGGIRRAAKQVIGDLHAFFPLRHARLQQDLVHATVPFREEADAVGGDHLREVV